MGHGQYQETSKEPQFQIHLAKDMPTGILGLKHLVKVVAFIQILFVRRRWRFYMRQLGSEFRQCR